MRKIAISTMQQAHGLRNRIKTSMLTERSKKRRIKGASGFGCSQFIGFIWLWGYVHLGEYYE